ncbi:MAG: rod shape-determining protein MreC [Planctomycetota bacterium]
MTGKRLVILVACVLGITAVLPARFANPLSTPTRWLADTALSPVTGPLHRASTAPLGGPGDHDADTPTDPAQHPVLALQLIAQLQDQVARLRVENQRLRQVRELLEGSARVIQARVTGSEPGTGQRVLRLNKGSNDGLAKGHVVVFGGWLVGQVIAADPSTARVRLITSAGSEFQVAFSSPDLNQPPRVERPNLILEPNQARFAVLAGVSRDTAITQDDLARLVDPRWPPEAQAFFVGRVTQINRYPDDPELRKAVYVQPALRLDQLATVDVIVP